MLFEQQKREAGILADIESRVKHMKDKFKVVMLENNTWA
jgi:hypothetical protein